MILNQNDLVNEFDFNVEHALSFGNTHKYLKTLRENRENIQVNYEEEKNDSICEAERIK